MEVRSFDFVTLVKGLRGAPSSREPHICALQKLAQSHELRDFDWRGSLSDPGTSLYSALFYCLRNQWNANGVGVGEKEIAVEAQLWDIWMFVLECPTEFDSDVASKAPELNMKFIHCLMRRLRQISIDGSPGHGREVAGRLAHCVRACQCCLHWLYAARPDLRPHVRSAFAAYLRAPAAWGYDGGSACLHIRPLLRVLLPILRGLSTTVHPSAQFAVCKALLFDVLMPLHAPNAMIDWREQQPVLGSYHRVLVLCVLRALQVCLHCVVLSVFSGIISHWPQGYNANTPKEVLLLHEMEAILEFLVDEGSANDSDTEDDLWEQVALLFLPRMAESIGRGNSDNIRPTQRALTMLKSTKVMRFLSHPNVFALALQHLLPALYRNGEASWNPTVNKLAALALIALRSAASDEFDKACDDCFSAAARQSKRARVPSDAAPHLAPSLPQAPAGTASALAERAPAAASRLPPTHRGIPRPRGVQTVMPGTLQSPVPPSSRAALSSLRTGRTATPDFTVTGVAPWALQQTTPQQGNEEAELKTKLEPNAAAEASATTGSQLVLAYIDSYAPHSSVERGPNDWETALTAVAPTLLKDLKFHQLVFAVGKPLGTGTFSTVKYARHVQSGKSQSTWPEYAVKIISCESLQEFGYYADVEREMSILRLLSHPGVCRSVSSFRYTSSAYIVLEYCSRGDLHTLCICNGPVSTVWVRFILGELCVALGSLHELGISFNDLKPENVLVCKSGHVKLTDFGACRPFTAEARLLLENSTQNLEDLRSGDWRSDCDIGSGKADNAVSLQTQLNEEKLLWNRLSEAALAKQPATSIRCEGTPAYLPPEVLEGHALPGISTDAWALGCLMSFLLAGRPPFYGDQASVQQQHKLLQKGSRSDSNLSEGASVSFAPFLAHRDTDTDDTSGFFRQHDLLDGLLQYRPQTRYSVVQACHHEFITIGDATDNGKPPPIAMHPPHLHHGSPPPWPPFASGVEKDTQGGKAADPWARRQFSVLWSAMPDRYDDEDRASAGDESVRSAASAARTSYDLVEIGEESETGAPFKAFNASLAG
eukprot:GSChrysophyteH1.ASY1.ANO1.2731.1 assembled CDS